MLSYFRDFIRNQKLKIRNQIVLQLIRRILQLKHRILQLNFDGFSYYVFRHEEYLPVTTHYFPDTTFLNENLYISDIQSYHGYCQSLKWVARLFKCFDQTSAFAVRQTLSICFWITLMNQNKIPYFLTFRNV